MASQFPCFEVPLRPSPQKLTVQLGQITYILTIVWRDAPQQGWVMDIADSQGAPIINGIPLVTGCDLLAQYRYLNLGGGGILFMQSDSDPDSVATFTNLGVTAHLYWAPGVRVAV